MFVNEGFDTMMRNLMKDHPEQVVESEAHMDALIRHGTRCASGVSNETSRAIPLAVGGRKISTLAERGLWFIWNEGIENRVTLSEGAAKEKQARARCSFHQRTVDELLDELTFSQRFPKQFY